MGTPCSPCGPPGEREIQFSAEEIGHVDEVLDVAVSACSAFGELDFVVDAFQEAIGQAGVRQHKLASDSW